MNIDELEERYMKMNRTFSENSQGTINPTELVAMLIADGKDFVSGIENVCENVKGSCSVLILTKDGIIAARDKLGRTPIIIGKRDGAYSVAFETCAFPNLGYEIEKYIGPGEIVRITAEGHEQFASPMTRCRFVLSSGCITDTPLHIMKT